MKGKAMILFPTRCFHTHPVADGGGSVGKVVRALLVNLCGREEVQVDRLGDRPQPLRHND